MRHAHRALLVLLLFFFGSAVLHPQVNANDELQLGIADYEQAKYQDAVGHFRKAVSLDPHSLEAHLHLATAYAQQFIPGTDDPHNRQLAEAAESEYRTALELDANDLSVIKGIAALNTQTKKFDKAKEYYRKAIEINGEDPEPYFSIAVIDWTQSYQPRMEARAKLSLRPDQPLINNPVCWEVRGNNQDFVKDGINMLVEALKHRPDYDDAMAYMNLLYRERADIQCEDRKAHAADLEAADKWVDLTMAAKKAAWQKHQPHTDENSDDAPTSNPR